MKPLNSKERSSAFLKFFGVYTAILVIPLVIFYLLLYIPNTSIAEENKRLKAVFSEQGKLVETLGTMGDQLKNLEQIDAELIKQQDEFAQGQTLRVLKEYENNIESLVFETKRDSAGFIEPKNKKMAKGIINSIDAFLTYRNTIGLLRQTIKEKGISSEEIEKLHAQLKETENKLETCKLMLSAKPAEQGSGGGGSKQLEQLQAQLKDCENKLKLAQQSKPMASPSVNVAEYTGKIEELEAMITMSKAACDESKADSRIINCNQRKSLYQNALAVYTKLQTSEIESVKKEAVQKVKEITTKIKHPPVGCE
jgi:hypothetical protein